MGGNGKRGVCLLLCILCLAGCGRANGPDEVKSTALSVDDRGRVTSYLVGNFAREYYSLPELERMVTEEADGSVRHGNVVGADLRTGGTR